MKTHYLKSTTQPFSDVKSRLKKAEFRNNDRDFAVGDLVVLMHWKYARDGIRAYYTGERQWIQITHIQTDFGIPEGFCVLSFVCVEQQPELLVQ